MLEAGRVLVTDRGDTVTVGTLYGAGGQGEVYRASTPSGARALKWYYPQLADARQRQILESLIGSGWHDERFLWPQLLVTDPAAPEAGFGYLMDVRPERFTDLPTLFRRDPAVAGVTMRALVTAALHTVEAYRALHGNGIAYRDINWGNIFFEPVTGDVLVCDNDNAVVEGETALVAGTMDFMAPELVRGDPGAVPCTQTDLHSLAVLLFLLLMNHHPLEGRAQLAINCLNEPAKRQLFGSAPVFVYDPADESNRPVAGEQDTVILTWSLLPRVLKELFVTTFTAGLRDPAQRVRESQWQAALAAVRDSIVACAEPGCGSQNLTEPGAAALGVCRRCRTGLALPARLEVFTGGRSASGAGRPRRSVMLGAGDRLFGHHLRDSVVRHDFAEVVGEVTRHPSQPDVLGLTNRSAGPWTARREGHPAKEVPPGRSVGLAPGMLVEFGAGSGAEGRIRV